MALEHRFALLGALLCQTLLVPGAAQARYRFEDATAFDHRGQWGLRFESVGTYGFTVAPGNEGATGFGLGFEAGFSRGLAYTGDELSLRLRPLVAGPLSGLALLGGYRVYFGYEHWKTFTDLDLYLPLLPSFAAGAHLAAGVLYDLGRHLGISLSVGVSAAVGTRFFATFDGALGLQLRL
ncbi:MAG: hypothetical protein D6729_15830 [Deltaproteobacteria bacterium]|nr:MAG: hypothetical protein D6729_15830 [Deltaproteobacteria bacterium]